MFSNGQRHAHTLTGSTFKAPGLTNNGSWKNLSWIPADFLQCAYNFAVKMPTVKGANQSPSVSGFF